MNATDEFSFISVTVANVYRFWSLILSRHLHLRMNKLCLNIEHLLLDRQTVILRTNKLGKKEHGMMSLCPHLESIHSIGVQTFQY